MSNGEHEIRTPKGLRIGNRSVVDGKNMLQIKRGGCEDYISAESLVECIHGLPVKSITILRIWNGIFVLCWRERIDLCVILKHGKVKLFRMRRM